jgi:hypothetical protein
MPKLADLIANEVRTPGGSAPSAGSSTQLGDGLDAGNRSRPDRRTRQPRHPVVGDLPRTHRRRSTARRYQHPTAPPGRLCLHSVTCSLSSSTPAGRV